MPRPRPTDAARDALLTTRRDAQALAQGAGVRDTRELLADAQRKLEERLKELTARGLGDEDFTVVQARAALAQVKDVLRGLIPDLRDVIVSGATRAADVSASNTAAYLAKADEAFRGVGSTPLALKEAELMSHASRGAEASVLRRLASSGELGSGPPHPAKAGILQRYGVQVIGHFERELQAGVIAGRSRKQMAEDITKKSAFLRGAPAYWAERIVRTELHGAYNRAGLDAAKKANEELDDMVKILSAVFDDRTGSDSLAVHGQVRRLEEPFETWYGPVDAPPDRPNDRGVMTPHRMSWELPEYLEPCEWEEVEERWEEEGRKGSPPERPLMSTVDVEQFGKPQEASSSSGSAAPTSSQASSGEESGQSSPESGSSASKGDSSAPARSSSSEPRGRRRDASSSPRRRGPASSSS